MLAQPPYPPTALSVYPPRLSLVKGKSCSRQFREYRGGFNTCCQHVGCFHGVPLSQPVSPVALLVYPLTRRRSVEVDCVVGTRGSDSTVDGDKEAPNSSRGENLETNPSKKISSTGERREIVEYKEKSLNRPLSSVIPAVSPTSTERCTVGADK